jgi:hypothetical protein
LRLVLQEEALLRRPARRPVQVQEVLQKELLQQLLQ